MFNRKRLFWATTAIVGTLAGAGAAAAQSTGTEATEVQEVVVTGARGPRTTDGSIIAETVSKTRSSITQEFISTQAPGQTILQSLNLTPGLNFTNADPYGNSGGNIRLRGFDGSRVSVTFDGIPLNDTGNYSAYTNQQLDSELIERASVNTGTTDVDSPTASATGGTINYTTRRPAADFGGWLQASGGTFNNRRIIGLVDTGEVGPWGTSAWFAASYTKYDKFKGEGELEKKQYNFRIYQPIGDNGDFVALSGHYNENRNNSYLGPNLATATGFTDVAGTIPSVSQGYNTDFTTTYTAVPVRAGVADVDPSSNNNYYGLRINPSNTGNVRLNSRFHLADNLIFTFDPSFQYTLANGGTQNTVLAENSALLRGTSATGGVDLNGDGDVLDSVRVMNPSNTNTHRYGVNSSLIWNLNDDHQLRAAYAFDWGRHRQTGDYALIDFSNPTAPRYFDEFGGRDDKEHQIYNLDGFALQNRDRLSYAMLNQFSAEYRGNFLNDALTINVGVRAPFFKRELNQNCYTQNSSSNVLCTSQVPVDSTGANAGLVTFAGSTTQYIRPYEATKKYDDVLPNVGATYRFGEGHSVYGSYAESLSAPRTDSLYTVRLVGGEITNPTVQPETSKNLEVGYRYNAPGLIVQAAAYQNKFNNRIVNTYDEELGTFVDRNVGAVETIGFDASVGWEPIESLSLYASASFLDSELQDNYVLNAAGLVAATKGKELVETPNESFGLRASYEFNDVFSAGIQGKYVGERWITDVNDQKVDAYTVVDLDARFDFTALGFEGTYLQFNVMNVFDEDYYVNLGTRTTTTPGQPGYSSPAFAGVGAPRTVMATLRYAF
ncbi:TonB-dependent receptor [Brevundimonas sp.]|jgi:iron complex outermembrane receptor protein|uniref:TonB-dependent receptor n=1 Tax=Brevundimonas sp. TaxID=1871086 RepID=UPI0037C19977